MGRSDSARNGSQKGQKKLYLGKIRSVYTKSCNFGDFDRATSPQKKLFEPYLTSHLPINQVSISHRPSQSSSSSRSNRLFSLGTASLHFMSSLNAKPTFLFTARFRPPAMNKTSRLLFVVLSLLRASQSTSRYWHWQRWPRTFRRWRRFYFWNQTASNICAAFNQFYWTFAFWPSAESSSWFPLIADKCAY